VIEAFRVREFFDLLKRLKPILREEEVVGFGAYYFFLLGAFLTILFFDAEIASAAITASLVGDAIAAIIGKLLGGFFISKKLNSKSFEGAIVGGLAATLAVSLFIREPASLFLAFVTFMFAEIMSRGVYDNLTIPLALGLTLTMLKKLIT